MRGVPGHGWVSCPGLVAGSAPNQMQPRWPSTMGGAAGHSQEEVAVRLEVDHVPRGWDIRSGPVVGYRVKKGKNL